MKELYICNDEVVPPETLQLWTEVGRAIETNQIASLDSVADSIASAYGYIKTSLDARYFCERHLESLVHRLLTDVESRDNPRVLDSLHMTCLIVAQDLSIQSVQGGECVLVPLLGRVFNKVEICYMNRHGVMLDILEKFRAAAGFRLLHSYLMERLNGKAVDGPIPALETLQPVLEALFDSVVATANTVEANSSMDTSIGSHEMLTEAEKAWLLQPAKEYDMLQILRAFVLRVDTVPEDDMTARIVAATVKTLYPLFDRLAALYRTGFPECRGLWYFLLYRMISSTSLELRQSGWEQMDKVIETVTLRRPPPRSYVCSGAGATICNGEYQYVESLPQEDADVDMTPRYVRMIPSTPAMLGPKSEFSRVHGAEDLESQTMKKLTLSRHHGKWFISELDAATNDYYHNTSDFKKLQRSGVHPPVCGWETCHRRGENLPPVPPADRVRPNQQGENPPPILTPVGVMVPKGEEYQTMEHQLAHWMIEVNILACLFRESTARREQLFTTTISFLSFACTRYGDISTSFGRSLTEQYVIRQTAVATGLSPRVQTCVSSLVEQIQAENSSDGPFPSLEVVALATFLDAANGRLANIQIAQGRDELQFAEAVTIQLNTCPLDFLALLPQELVSLTFLVLHQVFGRAANNNRATYTKFYSLWCRVALGLISCSSPTVKISGWDQVSKIIKVSVDYHPPPRSFICHGAGASMCNGEYYYAGAMTMDGYAQPCAVPRYERLIQTDTALSASFQGPTSTTTILTLFLCTIRSQQKWWFLSEADEEQPGTDRDIDYYQRKSKGHEVGCPPPDGWSKCRPAGFDPPPTLTSMGLMVPKGQESQTFVQQVARWMIENKIVERILNDITVMPDVFDPSTIISFLSTACKQHREISTLFGVSLAQRHETALASRSKS